MKKPPGGGKGSGTQRLDVDPPSTRAANLPAERVLPRPGEAMPGGSGGARRGQGPVPEPDYGDAFDIETGQYVRAKKKPAAAPAPPAPAGPALLWAILDAARDPAVYDAVATNDAAKCLFAGKLDLRLARAAPWLVRLDPESPLRNVVLKQGWGHSWGILLRTAADLATLRKHFRRFLRVTLPNEKPALFRYYDPRVLRAYLPTCNERELAFVFGPVEAYITETEKGAAREFLLAGTKLEATTTTLRAALSVEKKRAHT